MRKWMGLGVAFASTLAFAAVLVTWQIRTRQDELRLQYALSAARLGRAIELKYESSREVVNNVTSVLRVAESETKSALLEASEARAKQELNAEVEQAAAALKQKLEQEQTALTQATAREKAAWKGAFDALDDCLAKVALSTTAQQEVVKASLAADSAEGQLSLGLTALGNAQAMPQGVDELQQALTTAKAEVVAKKAEADTADELAKKTCEKAGDAKAALAASENKAAAERRVKEAAKLAESAKQARDHERRTPSETFQASVAHLRSPAYLFALGMKQHLPPSYAPHIDACTDKPGDVELCVARVIAKINGSPGTLFPCPQDGGARIEGPTLTDGGLAVAIPSTDQHHHAICAKVPIDELFSILPTARAGLEEPQRDRDGDFDAQVLLSSSGQVLRGLENADTHLRIVRFPQFQPAQGQVSSMAEGVQIGPDSYRVFFQPVRVTMATALGKGDPKASGKTESNDVVVAGLVRESRLKTAATQISLGSYLWFVLLLAFGLLCLPLAKLWFLSTRSSFGRFAVTLLGASAVLITLLTIVLTLGLVAHNRLAKRLELQLADVAYRLGDKLRTRARDSATRLQAFTRNQHPACSRPEVTQSMFAGDDQPSKVCERAGRQDFAPGSRLFFADEQGRQTIKYARAENVTAPIKVGFRDYFKRAMDDEPVCSGQACTFKTFPEVVRSATSGKFVLVVATKLPPPAAPPGGVQPSVEQRSRMAALETELALTELVLPSAFQAAIVQDDGKVMLHSDSNARFGQALFADLDSSEALRAAMTAEQAGSFDVRYLGIPSRLAVQPLGIEGSKWFAVAIAPRSIIDATAVNIGLTTLVAFGCLLLLIVALAFVSLVATQTLPWIVGKKVPGDTGQRRRRILSLRPHARYATNYATVGLFATRAAIILGVGSLLSCGYSSLWLIASVLTTALVLVWLPGIGLNGPFETTHRVLSAWLERARERMSRSRVRHGIGKAPAPARARLGVSYPLALTGLVGVAISAPATALFASSYDYYAETLVRTEQHHLVEALRTQPRCLRPPSEGPDCANVIQTGNFPPSQAPAPDAKGRALEHLLNPVPWLADKLPLLGSRVPALLTRADLASANVFSFVRTPPNLVHKNAKGEAVFATPVPSLLSTDYSRGPLLWTAFGFATFLGLGWVAVSCTLRRLFLLKTLAEQRETRSDDLLSKTLLDTKLWEKRRCTLVLHPSPRLKAALLARPATIDFTTANEQQLGEQKPGQLWLVPNLEALLHDKELAARIERYAPLAHRFVVLSAVEPLRRAQPELLDAWTRALSSFREVEGLQPKQKHRPPTTIAMAGWWRDCDADERRILSQLALDGYTNPHPANIPAIKHLVGRGLLSSNRLTIASPAFANYVRHATTAADIQSWEDAAEGSLWQAIKVPLGTGVAALLTALAASKPELGVASALVPLATVSLPAILKVLAAMVNKT
jgi:hypothetical protein